MNEIIRGKSKKYVLIDVACVNNKNLSWAAKGVFVYLESHEKDDININFIINADKETINAINELISVGYLVRNC